MMGDKGTSEYGQKMELMPQKFSGGVNIYRKPTYTPTYTEVSMCCCMWRFSSVEIYFETGSLLEWIFQ